MNDFLSKSRALKDRMLNQGASKSKFAKTIDKMLAKNKMFFAHTKPKVIK